jgi:hypothetical protein
MNFASGSQLAQVRPTSTSAESAYTAEIQTEISRIVICNTTGTAASFSLYHDDDGSTFNDDTAIYESKSVPANDSIDIKSESVGGGLMVQIGGQVGIKSGTANALNFTIYGTTAHLASN